MYRGWGERGWAWDLGMLHSGDNDSTGTMAGAWFGALYVFYGVPVNNFAVSKFCDWLREGCLWQMLKWMETFIM